MRYSSGSLLKSPTSPTVYLVVEDGSKYAFRSAEEFKKYGYRFDLVKTVTEEELAAHPAAPFTGRAYHTTGDLVKYPASPGVYMIENRTKRGFPSAAVFLSYASFDQIPTIDLSFQYPDGPVMSFPDGVLVKGAGPTVYLMENQQKRAFTSAQSFWTRGYDFGQIRQVEDSDLARLSDGASLE